MTIYYVDYENVNSQGLKGVENLTENDEVNILYSKKADHVKIDILTALMASKASIRFIPVHVGTPNALDFQLITLLFLHYTKENRYFIISRDSGYDCCIKTALELGADTIARCENIDVSLAAPNAGRSRRRSRRRGQDSPYADNAGRSYQNPGQSEYAAPNGLRPDMNVYSTEPLPPSVAALASAYRQQEDGNELFSSAEEALFSPAEETAVVTSSGEEAADISCDEKSISAYAEENTAFASAEENTVSAPAEENTVSAPAEENTVSAPDEENTVSASAEENTVSTSAEEDAAYVSAEESPASTMYQVDTFLAAVEETAPYIPAEESPASASFTLKKNPDSLSGSVLYTDAPDGDPFADQADSSEAETARRILQMEEDSAAEDTDDFFSAMPLPVITGNLTDDGADALSEDSMLLPPSSDSGNNEGRSGRRSRRGRQKREQTADSSQSQQNQSQQNQRQSNTQNRQNQKSDRKNSGQGRQNQKTDRQDNAQGRQNQKADRQDNAQGRQNQKSQKQISSQSRQNQKTDKSPVAAVTEIVRKKSDVALTQDQAELVLASVRNSATKQQFYNYFAKKLGQKSGLELYHSIKSSYNDLIAAGLKE